jgi:hypothetical protein
MVKLAKILHSELLLQRGDKALRQLRTGCCEQSPCSFGLSATSQQYFSQNKSATNNQPPVLLSEQISTSHQLPAKRTG